MIKTLEEINQEFLDECVLTQPDPEPPEPASDETDRWVAETLAILEGRKESSPPPPPPAPAEPESFRLADKQEPFHPADKQEPFRLAEKEEPFRLAEKEESFHLAEKEEKYPELYEDMLEPDTDEPEPYGAEARELEFPDTPEGAGRYEIDATETGIIREAGSGIDEPDADVSDNVVNAPEATSDVRKYLNNSERGSKKHIVRRIADIMFYAVIVFILITTLIFSGRIDYDGFRIFSYKAFNVLTGSMEREIPQGALVITKSVKSEDIKIGDDITYIRSDNATVTHRVINIIEDFEGSGIRGFETQGIANPDPDIDIVYEGNVIGVVKFTIPELGATMMYISENIGLVFLILGGILVALIALGRVFQGPRREKEIPVTAV